MEMRAWAEIAASIVTAFATVVLAWVTLVLARQTKRLADVGEQPNVVVTIEPNRRSVLYLDMHVQNTGTAAAYDIEISFDPPPTNTLHPSPDRHIPLDRISILKPTQSISSSFSSWKKLEPKVFNVRISWRRRPDLSDREYLSYSIDLNRLAGISRLGEDPSIEIAKSTTKLANYVEKIGLGWTKISVNTYTSEDRDEEQAAIERQIQSQQEQADGVTAASESTKSPDETARD